MYKNISAYTDKYICHSQSFTVCEQENRIGL